MSGTSAKRAPRTRAFVSASSFPWFASSRKGLLSFTYSPRLDRYQDFSALDNTGHRLVASLETTPTPISRLNVSASFTQTQDQGDPTDPEADILISRRTERRRGSFGVSYRNRLGGRFLWGFSTSYTALSFKDIEDFDTGDTTPIVDREALSGSLDLLRSLSRTTSLGVRLGYGQFELDVGGKEESREVGLILEHAVGRSTQLALGLGIFESEGDAALGPGGSPNDTRDGSQGFLTLTRQLRKIELSLTGRHSPASGGTLDSTSTDSSLGFYVGGEASRRSTWGVSTRYTRREPTDEDLAIVETAALGLSWGLQVTPSTATPDLASLHQAGWKRSGGGLAGLERCLRTRVGLGAAREHTPGWGERLARPCPTQAIRLPSP